jgi:hypothetical protein
MICCILLSAATFSAQCVESSRQASSSVDQCRDGCGCQNLSNAGCYGIDGSAELLFWKPFVGGTEFAADYDAVTLGKHSHFIDFDYHLGYRIGLAFQLPYENWKISTYFTSLHSTASNNISGNFLPNCLLQAPISTVTVTSASAKFDLHYYVFDLLFGKEQSFGKSFLWTPALGVKGALIHQDFDFGYSGGSIASGVYHAINKNNFNGVGLQGDIRMEWVLGAGFRLLGKLSGSLLWGKFNLDQKQKEAIDLVDLQSDFYRYCPNANMMVALLWGDYINKQTYLGASIGFESQYWWRQNQMPVFTSTTLPIYFRISEDFNVQGLVASVYLNF